MNRIKVLIVDDSATVRQTLQDILSSDPDLEVIGAAPDPYAAVRRIEKQVPDVIILDVEMPRMDGLTFLDRIMRQHPIPVVMCSTLTTAGSETALEALERGAVDILEKPRVGTRRFFMDSRIMICDVVKSAAKSKLRPKANLPLPPEPPPPKLSPDVILPKPKAGGVPVMTDKLVVVGASTGGTEALRVFLEQMPVDCPGILIVQHMPEHFTAAFAQRLNRLCRIHVKEAEDKDPVLRGQALIAPGGRHMLLKREGSHYHVQLLEGPMVSRHRPSVNVLFRSAARYGGQNVVGVIMTGMGDDGAMGMLEMKQAGAFNLAQDESSSVVFGMPCEAIKAGAVDKILSLDQLAPHVITLCKPIYP
jgi:two-component system chemotaxis response regulator CheB